MTRVDPTAGTNPILYITNNIAPFLLQAQKLELKSNLKRMSGADEVKVVSVTGASGYIASWLVKLLLRRGYTVKASVRDPSQSSISLHYFTMIFLSLQTTYGS